MCVCVCVCVFVCVRQARQCSAATGDIARCVNWVCLFVCVRFDVLVCAYGCVSGTGM